jgi:transcriptional regulator with XRE-family HTH domain
VAVGRSGGRRHREKGGIGEAVAGLRKQAGLSRQALADRACLSRSTVEAIEKDKSEPTWGTARRLAEALKVPLSKLALDDERLGAKAK